MTRKRAVRTPAARRPHIAYRPKRDVDVEAPPPSSRRGPFGYRFATAAALVRLERLGVPQAQRIVSDWAKYVDTRMRQGKSPASTAEHIARFERQHLARPYARDPEKKTAARASRGGRDPDRRCPRGMTIQTLIFPKSWTPARASSWARGRGFTVSKIDETSTSLRIRQHDPSAFTKGSFRTISIGKTEIRAVVGCPRPGSA